MKTAELEGALLDLWVARAEGEVLARAHPAPDPNSGTYWLQMGRFASVKPCPGYSRRWADGGPIIERERIEVVPEEGGTWEALYTGPAPYDRVLGIPTGIHLYWKGSTSLIAAMRAYVASKFGDEVPDVADSEPGSAG